jgi:hypothetical protein
VPAWRNLANGTEGIGQKNYTQGRRIAARRRRAAGLNLSAVLDIDAMEL